MYVIERVNVREEDATGRRDLDVTVDLVDR